MNNQGKELPRKSSTASLNNFRIFTCDLMVNIDLGNLVKGGGNYQEKKHLPASTDNHHQESLSQID